MPSRRSLLLGGGAVAAAALVGVGAGVEQGALPGRPWLQAHLGLDGEDGTIPDVTPGVVDEHAFVSRARGGVQTGWSLIRPPGPQPTRVVVALHGHGQTHDTLTGPTMGLDRYLAAHVEAGGVPFAIAAADGGTSYWHPRPDGTDAGAMVTDELLPRLARSGFDLSRIGLIGWSMGGYGALRLGSVLGPPSVGAVVASSPALWTDPDDASSAGFADAAEYEADSVFPRVRDLRGTAVRVDVGTGDPFYRAVEQYVDDLESARVDVTSTFEPGGHTTGYWRRMLPAQLAFLGRGLQQPQP